MPNYRRAWAPGGTYFFTVNLWRRKNSTLLLHHIDVLRDAIRWTRNRYPFLINGWVVLPDHMHCIITLPEQDTDYALRWRLIKTQFSKNIDDDEWRPASRQKRGERGIWQRRYWEHSIRDEQDFVAHMNYVHFNPVKHGLVARVCDWPYSTFHRLVQAGVYPLDWSCESDPVSKYHD